MNIMKWRENNRKNISFIKAENFQPCAGFLCILFVVSFHFRISEFEKYQFLFLWYARHIRLSILISERERERERERDSVYKLESVNCVFCLLSVPFVRKIVDSERL